MEELITTLTIEQKETADKIIEIYRMVQAELEFRPLEEKLNVFESIISVIYPDKTNHKNCEESVRKLEDAVTNKLIPFLYSEFISLRHKIGEG